MNWRACPAFLTVGAALWFLVLLCTVATFWVKTSWQDEWLCTRFWCADGSLCVVTDAWGRYQPITYVTSQNRPEPGWHIVFADPWLTPSVLVPTAEFYRGATALSFPLWIPLFAVGALLLYIRLRTRPSPAEYCPCGYNLTGNVSGRCPECGTAVGQTDSPPERADLALEKRAPLDVRSECAGTGPSTEDADD
jgi:hypothetical protein